MYDSTTHPNGEIAVNPLLIGEIILIIGGWLPHPLDYRTDRFGWIVNF